MRVLIADDDRLMAKLLAVYVQECGHTVVGIVTGGGLAVIQEFARLQPDVVLLDILMPRFNGLTVSHTLLSRNPDVKIVFVSGSVEESHPFVTNCGVAAYLRKPLEVAKLREVLDSFEAPAAA
jgi:CheY-like chemotaxis protein